MSLISSFCEDNQFHKTELIKHIKDTSDNNWDFMEPFHAYYDIYTHYVYLQTRPSGVIVELRTTVNETSVAIISPEYDENETIF